MDKPALILKPSAEEVTVGKFQRKIADRQVKFVLIHLKPDSSGYYASVVSQDDTVRELWTENRMPKEEESIDNFVSFLTRQCGYRGDIVIRGDQSEFLFEVKSSL